MFLLLTCFLAVVDLSCAGKPDQFNWDEIQPSWDLEYTPCYGELECARLLLPLDWLNEEDKSRTVAVAIIKRPAKVDITDDAFGGTVITNPGGPGDSGVVHILKNGHYLQGMVDGKLYYEVLSFDPRGMFHSTPVADCYEDDADRSFSEWQMRGFGLLGDSSAQQFRRRMAHATAFGQRCARADKGQSSIREFMSTASVARDMLAMVEKIELLRQKKIAGAGHDDGSLVGLELRANEHDASEARIQYFGTSYGTFLGNTFLSMFPGRVHRMILDGLVVPEEYVDLEWSTNLADTTKVVEYFYKACFTAQAKCTLWRASDASWKDIKSRVDKLIHDLDAEPQPVVTTSGLETVITGVEVRVATLDPLYAPLDHFEGLATLLDDAMQGNYTFLVQRIGFSRKVDLCSSSEVLEYTWMDDANMAVRCGDGKDATDYDLSYWESYVQRLKGLSPDIGDLWAEGTFSCSGWQIRPKYHFGGPFTSPEADASIRPGRPSAPLLLLSSLYDPVTPLRSANKAAQGHPGSRVLTQKSVGHCAFLSSPSGCTKGYIREYMETGKMPSEGTECEADCVPWEDCPFEKAQLPR